MKNCCFRLCTLILALTMLLASIAVAEDSILVTDELNAPLGERPLDDNDLLIDDGITPCDDQTVSIQTLGIDLQLDDIPLEGGMTSSDETVEGLEAVNASIPKAITLGIKEKYALKAKNAAYSSSEPAIASVSKAGVITAKKKGTTVITVESASKTIGTCTVTVVAAPSKVKLPIKSATLGVEETLTIVPVISRSSHASFTYTSKNPKIATVNANGVITAKKAGSTTITVKTHNGKKATLKITVKKAPAEVTFKPDKITLKLGQVKKLKVSLPKDTASYKRTWASSNWNVATVDSKGYVTATGAGTATIYVKMFNNVKAKCKVTVTGLGFAPDFDFDSPSGHYKLSNYSNNGIVLVFGRPTCFNCRTLLSCLIDHLDSLYSAGVDVIVSLEDTYTPDDVANLEAEFAGYHYVYTSSMLWDYLYAVGDTSGMVTYPGVFIIDRDGIITHYSTGFVDDIDNLVAEALKVGTNHALPDPS